MVKIKFDLPEFGVLNGQFAANEHHNGIVRGVGQQLFEQGRSGQSGGTRQ